MLSETVILVDKKLHEGKNIFLPVLGINFTFLGSLVAVWHTILVP